MVHGGGTLTFDQIPQAIADLLGTDLATGQMIAGGAVVVAVVLMFMLAARSLKGGSETILVGAGIGLVLAVGIEWWPPWTIAFIGLILALLVLMYRGGGSGDPGAGAGM